jgi:hypothetical protein
MRRAKRIFQNQQIPLAINESIYRASPPIIGERQTKELAVRMTLILRELDA